MFSLQWQVSIWGGINQPSSGPSHCSVKLRVINKCIVNILRKFFTYFGHHGRLVILLLWSHRCWQQVTVCLSDQNPLSGNFSAGLWLTGHHSPAAKIVVHEEARGSSGKMFIMITQYCYIHRTFIKMYILIVVFTLNNVISTTLLCSVTTLMCTMFTK